MGTFKTLFSSEDGKFKVRVVEYTSGTLVEKFKIIANYDATTPQFYVKVLRDFGWVEMASTYEFATRPDRFGTWASVIRDSDIVPYKEFIDAAKEWIDAVFTTEPVEKPAEKKKGTRKKKDSE